MRGKVSRLGLSGGWFYDRCRFLVLINSPVGVPIVAAELVEQLSGGLPGVVLRLAQEIAAEIFVVGLDQGPATVATRFFDRRAGPIRAANRAGSALIR